MKFLTYIRSHVVLSSGIAIIAVVSMIIAGRVASRNKVLVSNESNTKKVSLVDVSDFKNNNSKVSADGIVESVSQADLKSQISAPVTSISVAIGNNVSIGQTIAVLQNADIRAQLDQARAGLQLAQGQYTTGGTDSESAKKTTLETIRSSYLTADGIVNIELSQFLYSSTGSNPSLSSLIVNRQLDTTIRDKFLSSKEGFSSWKNTLDLLTINSDKAKIEDLIILSQNNLNKISSLLDDVSIAISEAIKGTPASDVYTTLGKWQTLVTNDRALVSTAIKNLTSSGSGLSTAQAQISSAQAIVKNLEAQLAKTIITAPISGTIAALPLRVGELAQSGQLVATVVGGGGLQVKAYASGDDITRIKVGSKANIKGSVQGTVVSVAPSVSQVNKKVEVKVSVNDSEASKLVVGENVSVSIISTDNVDQAIANSIYLLPIQNIKIIPGNAYVFTVDSENKIVKNSVTLGKVQGDFIEVLEGITSDMKIVSPVYEIEEGETVVIQ